MPNEGAWRLLATLRLDGEPFGTYELDLLERVSIGRSERAGIHAADERLPRSLASLRCTPEGWVVENERRLVRGPATSMRVRGGFIATRAGTLFAPGAHVLLQRGDWVLEWLLGVRVTLEITPLSIADAGRFPIVRDRPRGNDGFGTLALPRLRLTDTEIERMAALYAYIIRGDVDPPRRIYAVGAELAGCTTSQMKSSYQNVQRKADQGRGLIRTVEDLGYHLVHVESIIGEDDLAPDREGV